MHPSLIIARKEFRAAFRNRLFLTITLLFLGLAMLSVYIGSSTKRAEMRIYTDTGAKLGGVHCLRVSAWRVVFNTHTGCIHGKEFIVTYTSRLRDHAHREFLRP